MRKVLFGCLLAGLLIGCSQAAQLAVIGGVRDGLAVGVMADQSVAHNLGLRYGLEANTGRQPIIAFLGGKFYLTSVGRQMPMSLGLGAVAYVGNGKTSPGLSLSLIIDRAFNLPQLFIEAGVDAADQGRFQLQLGYKIY
ncbi:MAG: hypothetical protein JW873_06795 [Candidatus Saganbacteria bacterium]|nr:hypothetical protein [Candidatus Saganbacteria bacterium]